MTSDKASSKPGPMGYHVPGWTWQKLISEEQRVWDDLGERVPERLVQGMAADPNLELLKSIVEYQKQDGIDDGFSFLHLTKAINQGQTFSWIQQYVGSCVSSGDMRTTAYRMMSEVFLLNESEQLPGIDIEGTDSLAFFAPYNYRAGRREGGLNGGDGSFCGAHIKGKMKWGHLPCSTSGLESDAFPEPRSERLYRQWGNSNSLLEQYKPDAIKFPLTESVKVTSADQAKDIITNNYAPLNICSNWGFKPDYKHPTWKLADGSPVWIYKRSGSWSHNLSCVGFVEVAGKWFVIVENSWGQNAHMNGAWLAIPADLFDSWLRSAECASVGQIDLSDSPPAWPEG